MGSGINFLILRTNSEPFEFLSTQQGCATVWNCMKEKAVSVPESFENFSIENMLNYFHSGFESLRGSNHTSSHLNYKAQALALIKSLSPLTGLASNSSTKRCLVNRRRF
eukprot:Gregarina_sp_Poly_1__9243@NODE_570_length_7488_cov_15_500606_g447_i0_p3_GENE_NODE_570_length_7488_cov_15_500606_g447_i0NODE_570_length_7488_cov_15_500606_g447_i0_p3_ORF_typecomplete_len109_score6_47_NODE_570_length_7488_cov_15_500606_g447_i020192345